VHTSPVAASAVLLAYLPNHIEDILDMIEIGKDGQRQIEDVKLSRYA
jgi:hypothetical protein